MKFPVIYQVEPLAMHRRQAFKYELRPTSEQQHDMRRFAGSCRFVFNKALALQKARYEQGEKKLGYAGLCKVLTEWRNSSDTPWLAETPTHQTHDHWAAYDKELVKALKPNEKELLKNEVLGRARLVAEASGGFLGYGFSVSAAEKAALEKLALAFS